MLKKSTIGVYALACFALLTALAHDARAQEVSLRNNLAYDATGTPNLSVEVQVGDHVSVGLVSWPGTMTI